MEAHHCVRAFAASAHRGDDGELILRAGQTHEAAALDIERGENGCAPATDILCHRALARSHLSVLVQSFNYDFNRNAVARLRSRVANVLSPWCARRHLAQTPHPALCRRRRDIVTLRRISFKT